MTDKSLTKIAIITSAHGVRGQVKIRCLMGTPEEIFSYKLTDASGKRAFTLTRQGIKDNLLIASISGITDRNEAELLKGEALYAPASAIPKNSHDGLIGLEARLENDKLYGKITAVHNFGAGDIIDIMRADGVTEMIPFTNDFIGDILVEKGYLVVFPPEYMEAKK